MKLFTALALALVYSRPNGGAEAVHVRAIGSTQPFAFSSGQPCKRKQSQWSSYQYHPRRGSLSASSAHAETEESASIRHHQSQPRPDTQRIRKPPVFPGASPIDNSVDIATCINQTGQTSPTNALLGKPSQCQCRHGYAQAFSLDPMPPTQKIGKNRKDRLNSGLLKLTCPLLVNSVDLLEDDKFMKEINAKLAVDNEEEDNEWLNCMDDAHKAHATARKELIFGEEARRDNEITDESISNASVEALKSTLGDRGAQHFFDAGVAGANPLAKNADVKCLHAWLADYLFRKASTAESQGDTDGLATEHPIGDAIVEALKERGIDISGTDTCHEVCSGCSRSSSASSDSINGERISVHVPIPTNRQRKKRRQL